VKDGDLHVFCGFIKNLSGDGAGSQRDLLSTSSESPGITPPPPDSRPAASNVSAWRFKSTGPSAASVLASSPLAASPAPARAESADDVPWHHRGHIPGNSSYWAELPRDHSNGTDSNGSLVGASARTGSGAGSGTTSPLSSAGSDVGTIVTASSVPPKKLSGLERCREIAFDELKITPDKMIGKGAFGVVFAGEWRGVRVAVKQLIGYLDDEQIQNVHAECALMQSCSNHPNIAKFIGLSSKGHTMCIVTQFYSNGSLHDAIIVRKMLFAPRTKLRMLREAALGVIHLHKESVIHRDIAARNVLLDEHLNVVLSDFGLARVKTDAFHHTKSSLGPVKYMSPESISKKTFSFASDCFAFGVLIWELTHAAEPYADEPGLDTFGIAMGIVNGSLRLKIDENKATGLGDLMRDCWRANSADRPTFDEVLQRLTIELDKFSVDNSGGSGTTSSRSSSSTFAAEPLSPAQAPSADEEVIAKRRGGVDCSTSGDNNINQGVDNNNSNNNNTNTSTNTATSTTTAATTTS
jgi:serine/threonine protein kinase